MQFRLVILVLLLSCSLQLLRAFPFPIPFFGPFTSPQDGIFLQHLSVVTKILISDKMILM